MLYDITPPVCETLKVWPGDTPLSREILGDIETGDLTTTSAMHSTVHIGAHADAPSHYGIRAANIDEQPLEIYIGKCQVLHVRALPGTRIEPGAIEGLIEAPRLLVATGTFPDRAVFNKDFSAFSPSLIDYIASQGVKLVGIDTPSVDLFDSDDLPSHKACLKNDVAILEGLALDEVPNGVYELIALPLKLVGFDASPVRAVLRTIN